MQMTLVRAKRQLLDSALQERSNLDEYAKDYLKSALALQQAKQLWHNATGLSFTIVHSQSLVVQKERIFW